MKNSLKAFLITLSIGGSALMASDPPKTLSAGFYDTAKPGKKLDQLLLEPGFDKAKGFSFDGKVKTLSEIRNSAIADALASQIKAESTDASPYRMQLAIVEITNHTPTGIFYILGRVTVEGTILGPGGKPEASFRVRVKIPESMGTPDPRAAADAVVAAILKDLR